MKAQTPPPITAHRLRSAVASVRFTEALEPRTMLCGFIDDSATVPGPHYMYTDATFESATAPASLTADGGFAATLAATALLPAGWSSRDVGAVAATGSAAQDAATGTFAVTGSGADISGAADEFHFASTTLAGDGQIVARVNSLSNTDPWAKAGVMFRDSLAANARNVNLFASIGNGVNVTARSTTAGQTLNCGKVAGATAPAWVKLVRAGNVFTGYYSTNGSSWTTVGSVTVSMASTLHVGLAVTSHKDGALNSAAFGNVAVTATGGAPASPTGGDIGAVAATGSSVMTAPGAYTVAGSGADIFDRNDEFHFVSSQLAGNGQVVARVDSLANTDPWAKAGVMFRDSLAASARNVNVFLTPGQGVSVTARTETGAPTGNHGKITGITAPGWVKLVRAGSVFTGYYSTNGTSWTTIGSVSVSMGSTVYVGLAVTSHKDGALNTARFSNVAITGGPTTPATLAAPTNLATQRAGSTSMNLTWTDNSTTETLFRVQRSGNNGSTWADVGTTATNDTSFTDTNQTPGATYLYRVRAENGSTTSAYSTAVSYYVTPSSTATPVLTGGDVSGRIGAVGHNSLANGVFSVTGSGADIFGNYDAFRFVQQTMNGDGTIVARVASVQAVDPWTKAGVMIREVTDPNARNVHLFVTPGQGVNVTSRSSTGDVTTAHAKATGVTAAVWLKLARVGNTFTASYSKDGVTWTHLASVNVPMSAAVNVGLAVCSHRAGTLATATFDNVSRTGRDSATGWVALAPAPLPRYEHAGLAVGGKLYSFGGFYNTDVETTTRSDVYNPATNTWTRIADMPEPLTHVGHATDGRYIYFAGGFVDDYAKGMPSTNHVWRYDTQGNAWSALPNLPQSIGAGAAAVVGRTLYFFGGTHRSGGQYVADSAKTWALNLDNTAAGWVQKASLGTARNHVGGVTIGNLIYAVGGQQMGSEHYGNSRIVSVYNTTTNAWTNVASLPIPMGHIVASTFSYNGKVRVIGGVTENSAETDTMYEYNPATNVWTLIGTIPGKRQSPLADEINGVIYMSGGFEPGFVYTSTYRTA